MQVAQGRCTKIFVEKNKREERKRSHNREKKWFTLLYGFFLFSLVFLLLPTSIIDPFNTYSVPTVCQALSWEM